MFKEYEVFRLKRPVAGLAVTVGSKGSVLEVKRESPGVYVVEFADEHGRTLGLATLTEDYMEHWS